MWIFFFFWAENSKFCRTILKRLGFKMMTWAFFFLKKKKGHCFMCVILLNGYKLMHRFINILSFWVYRDFCSQPSCVVSREQLEGMCKTLKEPSPTWPESKHSMAVRHSDLGNSMPGPQTWLLLLLDFDPELFILLCTPVS